MLLHSFLLLCFLSLSFAEEIKVPVISWNIRGTPLQMHSVSAFDSEPKEGILKDVLQGMPIDESVGVVAFVVDSISMEDLASAPTVGETNKNANLKDLEGFLDKQPHVLYPSISEPYKHLRKSSCGTRNIYVSDEKDSMLKKAIDEALEKSCVVIVHVPNDKYLNSEMYMPVVKGARKHVIGLFTGRRQSWVPIEPRNRLTRSLLAVDNPDEHFINFTCIIMYVENATLEIGSNETRSLPFPIDATGSCSSNETGQNSLELTFGESGDVSKVVLKLNFAKQYGLWSLSNDSSLTVEGGSYPGQWDLYTGGLEAPSGFSFSCSDFVLRPSNRSYPVRLRLSRLQIQPYGVKSKFAESFDCVPFMTLPIWMGIFVGLLFLVILNTGVYALFSIKTMDRFDDPKGKSISVPT